MPHPPRFDSTQSPVPDAGAMARVMTRSASLSALSRLRANRREIGRLLLAVMVLPLWLSLMATVSPAAAALLGQKAGEVFVICSAQGLKQISEPTEDSTDSEVANTECTLCHTIGCGMCPVALAAAEGLSNPLTEGVHLAHVPTAERMAEAEPPPGLAHPRAPPA